MNEDDNTASTLFATGENLTRYLVIQSKNKEKTIISLSPFLIEKQIEGLIGTAKSVKKLKNQTLLVETTRKRHTVSLKKCTKFFNLQVEVKEYKSLHASKGIVRYKNLSPESKENILEYLQNQGVTQVKRFSVKKKK